MSDLISRKLVLDKLKDFSDMYTLEEEARIVLETIVRIVTEQPTAYSVSKVVAELEKLPTYEFGVSLLNAEKYVKLSDLKEKIDIVRKGGVE